MGTEPDSGELIDLRRRVAELEIENRTHARMDTRLTAVEQWIAREDEWRAEQAERGDPL